MAQQEKTVDLPRELEVPWPYLQRHFGVTADCGNNTANVLLNFDERENRVYRINVGLGDPVASSEETFFRIFRDVEIIVSGYEERRVRDPHDIARLTHCQGLAHLLFDGAGHRELRGRA